jgi:hypothetical protein
MELMAGRLGDHARFANHDSSPVGMTRFLVSFLRIAKDVLVNRRHMQSVRKL